MPVPDYQYPSGLMTTPHRISEGPKGFMRSPSELLQNRGQLYLQGPPIDLFSLKDSDGIAE